MLATPSIFFASDFFAANHAPLQLALRPWCVTLCPRSKSLFASEIYRVYTHMCGYVCDFYVRKQCALDQRRASILC